MNNNLIDPMDFLPKPGEYITASNDSSKSLSKSKKYLNMRKKIKVNPFEYKVEYVPSPIPQSIFNKTDEKWAKLSPEAIPGLTEEIYISDHGKVYNNTKKIMLSQYNNYGYKRCKLPTSFGRKNIGVHRLVLLAFDKMPDQDADHFVPNHVDGDPNNNSFDNLEWATLRYNAIHAAETGLKGDVKLTVDDVKEICEMLESKEYTISQIAEKFDCNDSNIRNIKSGISWHQVSKDYNIDSTPRLKEDKIRKICEMLESGKYTDTEIADINDVSRTYVHDIRVGRRKSDISSEYNMDKSDKRNPVCDETVKKICEMLAENKYTESYIARECNVSRPYVHNVATGKTRTDISSKYFSDYKVSESKKTVTPEQIAKVKELLKTNKYTDNAISKMAGVSRWTVDRLKNAC